MFIWSAPICHGTSVLLNRYEAVVETGHVYDVGVREILDVENELRVMGAETTVAGLARDALKVNAGQEGIGQVLWPQNVNARP